jgi:hypothetical protein
MVLIYYYDGNVPDTNHSLLHGYAISLLIYFYTEMDTLRRKSGPIDKKITI